MPNKDVLLTAEGLVKLKSELKKLKEVDRKEVIGRIKTAKEFGDLSENSEYEDAKNEQAFIEGRIQELESMIKHAQIISNENKGTISVGNSVLVQIDGEEETFHIVGPTETDPISGKISSESPVGQALLGKKKGDEVQVQAPDGSMTYKIMEVK
jgi:transcription elongation factor GreA